MPNNSTKILFLSMLISGVLISLCANSWMGAWMGLEINLLSFIPLLSSNSNMFSTETSLKYFLIQAVASTILLFLILFKINTHEMFFFIKNSTWNNLIMTPLLMKIACAPFHWWLPSMMEGLLWTNCFIILSIQKITPLMLSSYMLTNTHFIQCMIIITTLTGAIGGFNQISLRKILSYSSINHIGWMLTALIMSTDLWFMYFTIYTINIIVIITLSSLTNSSFIPQMFNSLNNNKIIKLTLFIAMLSLGGLPPFMGFLPKWIIIQFMIQNWMILTTIILVLSSLMTLYYYMRMTYTAVTITNSENIWITTNLNKYNHSKIIMFSLTILLSGMLACTLIFFVY